MMGTVTPTTPLMGLIANRHSYGGPAFSALL